MPSKNKKDKTELKDFRLHRAKEYKELIKVVWKPLLRLLIIVALVGIIVVCYSYMAISTISDYEPAQDRIDALEDEVYDLRRQLSDFQSYSSCAVLEERIRFMEDVILGKAGNEDCQ